MSLPETVSSYKKRGHQISHSIVMLFLLWYESALKTAVLAPVLAASVSPCWFHLNGQPVLWLNTLDSQQPAARSPRTSQSLSDDSANTNGPEGFIRSMHGYCTFRPVQNNTDVVSTCTLHAPCSLTDQDTGLFVMMTLPLLQKKSIESFLILIYSGWVDLIGFVTTLISDDRS